MAKLRLRDRLARRLGYIKASAFTDRGGWFADWATQGRKSSTGISVTNTKANTLAVFYACMRNIAEDTGKLPVSVFRRDGENRVKLLDHPVSRLLGRLPNAEMTALSFRRTLGAHALSWGNGYAEIQRDIRGNPIALWPLRPDKVRPFRDKNTTEIWYEVSNDKGGIVKLHNSIVLHIAGLGFDGLVGYNVVKMARESIGLGLATEKFGGKFFANGANAGGAFSHPQELSDKAFEHLRRQIKESREGVDNAHKTLILEEGMEFNSYSIPPNDAQFLETREFSVVDVCRWFRMPPHKVQDLRRGTFSNIEHQALEYVTDALGSWIENWEQTAEWKLLSQDERDSGHYIKLNVNSLLRGDIVRRTAAYAKGRQWGWLSVDDIRALEDMNPLPEGDGDIYLTPLNMRDVSEDEPVAQSPSPIPPGNEDQDRTDAMIADCARRINKAEMAELEKHAYASKDRDKFESWLESFYEKHTMYIIKTVEALGCSTEAIQHEIDRRKERILQVEQADAVIALREAGDLVWEEVIRKAMK